MFPNDNIKNYVLGNDLKVTVLESGNLKEIRKGIIRLNTYVGNNLEPTINNIYMRVEDNGKYLFTRLIGIGSPSSVSFGDVITYKGVFLGINYTIFLVVCENVFLYKVNIQKNESEKRKITIYYGMDVSISNIYAINSNEAYVSQYIDHKAFLTDNGYVVCSRQNQDQPYYLEQGSLSKNVAFSIDGFQFFGNEYKTTNIPVSLTKEKLANKIYQYEFAYCALQSEDFDLSIDREIVFYGCFSDSHPDEIKKPLYLDKVNKIYKEFKEQKENEFKKINLNICFDNIICGEEVSEELNLLFPERKQEEYLDGRLLSFFTEDKAHVVLPCKEYLMERPSGNIIISKPVNEDGSFDFERVLSDTCYIYGVFSSLVVLGNTSFNKLLANQRNPLDIQKINGQRIFIKVDSEYRLLTMPTLFEMGLNYCKWYYKIKNDLITITTIVSNNDNKVMLNFSSKNHIEYDIIVTNLLTMSQNENECKVFIKEENKEVICNFDTSSMAYSKYPNLYFKIKCDKDYIINDDSMFYSDNISRNENILSFSLKENEFRLLIIGINEKEVNEEYICIEEEKKKYKDDLCDLLNGFDLKINNKKKKEIDSFNYLVYWYAHDALIHYLSPHGLEQYNGAAWGTRDVCQGPAEFFMVLNRFEEVRRIIINVYKHQFIESGSFPQWFMFDRFSYIQDSGSHGDIIVWPARLLSIYLEKTNDLTILDEKIEYTHQNIGKFTEEKYSLLEHLNKQIENIKANFIKDTNLSCYGGGDWDDTLQPCNLEDRNRMVSGWTVSLTYEMFYKLGVVLNDDELVDIANKIKEDYNKYLMKDGVVAGFIKFNKNIEYIIHPTDNVTKIKYRLLPLTRGIISEIFDYKQALEASKIVNVNLMFPDGVRLMDNTVPYKGGIKTFFNRAETAANFGREIGLQYCHANVRYCEAMHKLGNTKKLYEGMQKINPVVVRDFVSNALPRQRNSYYSSSDGDFLNRYEAMNNFDKLRTKEVSVKGGWRVYSSGPGIYLSTLISKFLGIMVKKNEIIFDPIIIKKLDGLEFDYKIMNKKVKIKYFIGNEEKVIINKTNIKVNKLNNSYRESGFSIPFDLLENDNEINIYLGVI